MIGLFIDIAGFEALAKALKSKQCQLTSLDVSGECRLLVTRCTESQLAVRTLAHAVRARGTHKAHPFDDLHRHCVEWVCVTGSNMGDVGTAALARALESGHCKLTRLNMLGKSLVCSYFGSFCWLDAFGRACSACTACTDEA